MKVWLASLWLMLCSVPLSFAVEVTDDEGRLIRLDSPPTKIVSLSPHLTELLFSLGVGDRIVATVDFSDYPAEAREIPRLGNAFSLSVEAVLALDPDLIVAWKTGGNARTRQQLTELGYVIYINEAKTLADIAATVERLGLLVGQPQRGEALAAGFREELARIRSAASKNDVSVFFQISDQQLYTVNSEHLIGQAISACGARNIFADIRLPVPMVSLESVVMRDPDIIVISVPVDGAESSWDDRWQSLGFGNRVRRIDASLITRPGLRMLDGIKNLCKTLRNH